MAAGLPEANFHLTDHWLSFFMLQHLSRFRQRVAQVLDIDWSNKNIEKVVITEYEERGFGGRGAFIDGLGQVRDMVQSHLLQVLALAISDPSLPASEGKMQVLDSLTMTGCELKQFSGLLESRWLTYHPTFADSTFCRVQVSSNLPAWEDVQFVMQTGKAMDVNLYTINVYQKDDAGIITFNIGKEEVGLGDVQVSNWNTASQSEIQVQFEAASPGFDDTATVGMTASVDNKGNGYILNYNQPNLYFPKPYAKIVSALVTHDYAAAFVTWPECKRAWEIVTGAGPSACLDPPPEAVGVYLPAFLCDKAPAGQIAESSGPAEFCDQHLTVKQLDDVKYACTDENDVVYGGEVDFYKAKCRGRKGTKIDL
jgi:glucose-6-phosphate 1-dehydrogenase